MPTFTVAPGGGNSATGSTWVGGVAPSSTDDALVTATSGNLAIANGFAIHDIDFTGYTGQLNFGGAATWTISGNLTLVATMTTTGTAFSTQVFTGTGSQTITTAGIPMGNITINSSGGTYQLQDNLTVGASGTGTLTQTLGGLDTNGKTVTAGGLSSNNGNVRTMTFGSSALNFSGNLAWNVATTNLTATANTATVTCSGSNVSFITWQNFDWNGMSLVFTGGAANTAVTTALTFANFTFTGTAAKTNTLTLYGNITTTGTFTINGNSAINRVLVASSVLGTTRTMTTAAFSLSNVDFSDVTAAGGGGTWTGTSLGNCAGNSNITFTTPVTRYWVGAANGNYSDVTRWSASSGGAGSTTVPLPQDTVYFDANSASAGTQITTFDMPRIPGMDCTGFVGRTNVSGTNTAYGSWILSSGMVYAQSSALTFAGRGSYVITSNGKTGSSGVTFNCIGGTYTFTDAFLTTGSISHNYGGIDFNSQTITTSSYTSGSATTRSLTGGTATINLTATGASNIWVQVVGGLTQSMTNTNIVIANASANQRDIVGNGSTFGTLTYTVAGSTGLLYIRGTGSDSFGAINFTDVTNARTLQFQAGLTYTVRDGTLFNVNGTSGKLMSIQTQTGGSAATLAFTTGTVSCDYLSVKDNTASVTTPAYAGANGSLVSGTTNWLASAPPSASTGNMFVMFQNP